MYRFLVATKPKVSSHRLDESREEKILQRMESSTNCMKKLRETRLFRLRVSTKVSAPRQHATVV